MRKMICLVLITVMSLSMTACNSKELPQGNGYVVNEICINTTTGFSDVLTAVMRERDFLTPHLPEGVTVKWNAINTSPEIRDGIVSGHLNISVLSSMAVIAAIENGLPLRILSGHIVNKTGIFSKNPDIVTVDDLLDANGIYVSSMTTATALAILAMCKDEFSDPQTLTDKLIAQDTQVSLIAFESTNEVDCIATGFPNNVRVTQIDGTHQVVDMTLYAKKYDIGNYYVVNENFYNNNPALIEAFRKAQDDALDFMINQPEEAAELLSRIFEIDKGIISEEMKVSFPRLEISGYDLCADLLYEAGILENPPKRFSELPNYEDIPK